MTTAITYAAALGCAIWFAQAALLFLHLARLRDVATADAPEPPEWPRVSAIVPARDEAASLESALRSRLDDDYPALQLVVVDDRSADATPDVINRLAAEDARVHTVRIEELPAGWLGKPHALECGVRIADGDWLLISDADVQFSPGGLRRAVAYCLTHNLDFLALVPEFRSRSFAVDVLWSVFMRVLGTFVDPAAVRRPDSRAAMGSGAFMLAKRDVFNRTPGFEHLRLETTDDVALGMMMKQAGGRCDFANGRCIASISIYDDLQAFFRGIEKNAGSLVRAPFAAVLILIGIAGLIELSPFVALFLGTGWIQWLGAAAIATATAATASALWRNTRMIVPALLWPIGWLLVAAGILRAAWLLHLRGGVVWRETFYSREELLGGQRFRML